jgi:heptosyltransferase-3
VTGTLSKEDQHGALPTAGIRHNAGALKEGSGPAVAEDFSSLCFRVVILRQGFGKIRGVSYSDSGVGPKRPGISAKQSPPNQMKGRKGMKLSLRYRADRLIRGLVMHVMGWITRGSAEQRVDLRNEDVKNILLVRPIFRMGNSILATPAILLFRENFPTARIDFVGSAISKLLFQNLPLDHHYEVYRSFPRVLVSYLDLLRRIRRVNYDLAVDVSGSSSAMGAFIVGISGARFRAGLRGKWDRWFNLRFPRPAEKNKYGNLPELIGSMGLKTKGVFPTLILSSKEKEQGHSRLETIVGADGGPVVGIFVGGRKTRGKRWRKESFIEIASRLRAERISPIFFVGPEETELIGYFEEVLRERIPLVFEPNLREFASLVAACDLFVACDSGLVHLACALRVRTVAIFLHKNFDRWGPPRDLGRIVYRETGATVDDVLKVCLHELSDRCADREQRQTVNG